LLKSEFKPSAELRLELQNHVKNKLAPYKYPRWVEFVDDLPKTVTGKIQRFRLRSKN
jgi:benzoate-CoA ligase